MLSPSKPASTRIFLLALALMVPAAALQLRMPAGICILHVQPDLVLFLALAAGLRCGQTPGAVLGFAGAYFLSAGIPFSPGALYFSHVVVGYLSGAPRSRLYTEHPLVPAVAGCLAGAAAETLFFFLSPRSLASWAAGAAAQSLYGLLICPAAFAILHAVGSRERHD
ncbi:MAG: hypothetical protein LC772_01185 [Chloroflexi bacterium]|nr:hypothetical protein [Chloroflexota bacterium]